MKKILFVLFVILLICFRFQIGELLIRSIFKISGGKDSTIITSDSFNMVDSLAHLNRLQQNEMCFALNNSNNILLLEKKDQKGIRGQLTEIEIIKQLLLSGNVDEAIDKIRSTYRHKSLSTKLAIQLIHKKSLLVKTISHPSYFDAHINDTSALLGICYLRKGEQINCIENHNDQRCILPIAGKGVYDNQQDIKKAIEYFETTLKRKRNDYTTRWLLNIAYSTIGQYPDAVPKDYYIDFSHYEKKPSPGYFKNKASALHLNKTTLYGGAILDDFNNDGLVDVFATSGDLRTNASLYINNGNNFNTENSDLEGITGGAHCVQADYNNDGLLDIFILRGGWIGEQAKFHPNSLLKNIGNAKFVDVTEEAGLLNFLPSHTGCWADFNLDGYLDLFIGNENYPSQLFKNNKDGSFTDVSASAGLRINSFVKGSFWGDINNDGLPDLFLSNYHAPNRLFINNGKNENGEYTFSDQSNKSGIKKPLKSFGCFMLDFNNDGWLDIYVSNYNMNVEIVAKQFTGKQPKTEPSYLYINQKDGSFSPLSSDVLDRSTLAMGLNYGDIDNDGYLDFYLGTGYPDFEALTPNFLFRNVNGTGLEDISYSSGLGHLQKGHSICFADIDYDGDNDIYVSAGGFFEADFADNLLFVNEGNDNHWISLKLEGKLSNRSAIGAKVRIVTTLNGKPSTIYREISSGGSYGSSSLSQIIGLGASDKIDTLEVIWPASGIQQIFDQIEVNKAYIINESHISPDEILYHPIDYSLDSLSKHIHHHSPLK